MFWFCWRLTIGVVHGHVVTGLLDLNGEARARAGDSPLEWHLHIAFVTVIRVVDLCWIASSSGEST